MTSYNDSTFWNDERAHARNLPSVFNCLQRNKFELFCKHQNSEEGRILRNCLLSYQLFSCNSSYMAHIIISKNHEKVSYIRRNISLPRCNKIEKPPVVLSVVQASQSGNKHRPVVHLYCFGCSEILRRL